MGERGRTWTEDTGRRREGSEWSRKEGTEKHSVSSSHSNTQVRKAQLSQRGRAMFRIAEHFAKFFKVTQNRNSFIPLHSTPSLGGLRRNIAVRFGTDKLKCCGLSYGDDTGIYVWQSLRHCHWLLAVQGQLNIVFNTLLCCQRAQVAAIAS